MGEIKQTIIKNRTYYFYNDIIDLKIFDAWLLKIERKSFKGIGIQNIGYITFKKIDDCKNIHSVNPLYLRIYHASGYVKKKFLVNIWFLTLQMKIKSQLKNTMMFLMELETESKK